MPISESLARQHWLSFTSGSKSDRRNSRWIGDEKSAPLGNSLKPANSPADITLATGADNTSNVEKCGCQALRGVASPSQLQGPFLAKGARTGLRTVNRREMKRTGDR
jgi:hypothetical protein